MLTPSESRRALTLVTAAAVETAIRLFGSFEGRPEAVRADVLSSMPDVIAYYAAGSSALAADFYDDQREAAEAIGLYVAEPVVLDRGEKIGRALAWATEPMFEPVGEVTPYERIASVVQSETARPYRDTITSNRRLDRAAVGWRRVASGGCKFCSMLAGRGAVYREETSRFASHPHCHCTAQPVFNSNDSGNEVDVVQYSASKMRPTAADRKRVRDYLREADGGSGSTKADSPKKFGFDSLTKDQVSHQLGILEKLPDTDYKATQLARYRARLADL